MLSLRELRRATAILDRRLSDSWLQRVVQTDEFRLVLSFHGAGSTHHLLLNCSPEFARLALLPEAPQAPAAPPPFVQYMRAHLGRAAFAGAHAAEAERQAAFRLRAREGEFLLVFSVLGKRSNIYLLDEGGILLFSMRRLEDTREDLAFGGEWTDPPGGLRSAGTDRWELVGDELYLEALQETYSSLELQKEFNRLARRLEQSFNKEKAFLERKAGNLSEDLSEAIQADALRKTGELLKSVLHLVRPGDRTAQATDYQTGEQLSIPLDAQLSPSANLEAYFRRYQKELRGAEAIRGQLEKLRARQCELERQQSQLDALIRGGAASLRELESFAHRPPVRKLLTRRGFYAAPPRAARTAKQPKGGIPSRLLPRRFRGEHGLEIWVGRSDEGNDYLTTRLARGNDLFFHLEGHPGSHVILRTEGRKDPPPEAILEACELAVHFSKLKDLRQVDVYVVPVKNVRKPKGAKRGLVYVTRGRTVHLRRDLKRLQSVLASRLDG
jgi:predicted ribosome quality control (RQC) complex YloA/Tae2 family protein